MLLRNRRLEHPIDEQGRAEEGWIELEARSLDTDNSPLHDERLALMFSCSHPKLAIEAQLAPILKALCGFSIDEIAAALFANPVGITKRITGAKAFLVRSRSPFDLDDRQ